MTGTATYLRDARPNPDGISRQRATCNALILSNGWSTPIEYVDNGVGANNRGAGTAWARMLADIGAGKIDVVASRTDRLFRSVGDYGTLRQFGARIVTANGELFDEVLNDDSPASFATRFAQAETATE